VLVLSDAGHVRTLPRARRPRSRRGTVDAPVCAGLFRTEVSPGEPGLRLRLSLVVRCGCVTHLASAVGTAVHGAVGFDPMAEDAASAMCTARRHLRYRTFEAVESSELLAAGERERAVVFVSARIA